MFFRFSRTLTGRQRDSHNNRKLGVVLAFVAGAINAGGFLAVQQYTSHMTGIVAAMADHLALGFYDLVYIGFGVLLSFLLGAISSAVMINFARRHQLSSEYALPLVFEAILLLLFGLLGAGLTDVNGVFVSLTVMVLCFMMGLQNAVITKISNAEIRTTHITGVVTDIGIELGKLMYHNSFKTKDVSPVLADRARLKLLLALFSAFFIGGVLGAYGFKTVGYVVTVPIAFLLLYVSFVPVMDDASLYWHKLKYSKK